MPTNPDATLRDFVSSTRQFHGECAVACRPGCAQQVRAAEAASELLAELGQLRIAVHGCACPAPFDACSHDEPLLKLVGRVTAELDTVVQKLAQRDEEVERLRDEIAGIKAAFRA